jgi:hypothetical protein
MRSGSVTQDESAGVAAQEGAGSLSVEELLETAQTATGLRDFGSDDSFLVGLHRIVGALDRMDASAYVRADIRARILHLLSSRLRLLEDARLHPEMRTLQILKPVIIVGLPRSGTTVTFDALALDPAFRYPRDWEWMIPWPATEAVSIDTDPRIALIQPLIDRMAKAAPELAAVQRLDCTAPGECNTGMMYHFSSTNYYAEFGTTYHAEWLIEGNPEGLYRDHKRLLQQMQWKGPPGRWLLKSPQHLFDLPALFATYTDARLVWTHRDPVSTFSSLASMLTMVQRSVRLDPDPEEVGAMVVKLWSKAILNALAARADNPAMDEAIFDLPHRDIVRRPRTAVRRIYEHVAEPYTPELERAYESFFEHSDNAKRLGKHQHCPEQFGIDPVHVHRILARYYDRFGDLLAPARIPTDIPRVADGGRGSHPA